MVPVTKRKPSADELLYAFLKECIDVDEADIAPNERDSGDCDYQVGIHLDRDRALREIAAKRAILAANMDPDTSQSPGYYAALWQCLLAVAAIYEGKPGYPL